MARWTIALLTALLAVTVAASGPSSLAAAPSGEAAVAKKKKKKCKKKGQKGAVAAKKCKRKKQPTRPPASLSLAPTSHNFGHLAAYTTASKVFTVTNAAGTAPSGPIGAATSGINPGNFVISENTCAGAALPGGQSCTLKVTYVPGIGGSHSATLTVSATPGGAPTALLAGSASP